MNMETEKKEYVAPVMTIVDMNCSGDLLLVGSGTDILNGDGDDYEDAD